MNMVDDRDIARWRLRTQRLVTPHAESAVDVVTGLLAVQAENASQASWAVASRTHEPRHAELASRLESGEVLRTHVLRPTWHFVSADDIAWLLELTAPRNQPIMLKQLQAAGIDGAVIERATGDVLDVLAHGHLTRNGMAAALQERGHALTGFLLMILLASIEFSGLICSGRPEDGEHTYALMSERVPSPRRLDRDEALAEVTVRYFTGHGPATERDLAYWATLTLTDVRKGLAQVHDRLESFEHDGRTYWHAPGETPPGGPQDPTGHLLQILDETYRGYQDSRWVLDAAAVVPRARESAIGMALVDAQMVAGMRRKLNASTVTFELTPFRELHANDLTGLEQAAQKYADFLGLQPALAFG